jgi:ABC-2 type transport system permease protein
MRNFWLVARHEFQHTALRRTFLLITLAVPAFLAVVIALSIFMETSGQSKAPLGYVDHAGVVDASLQATLPDAEKRIPIYAYPDEEAALAALNRGEIQAFFVLPAAYPAEVKTDLYTLEKAPSDKAWGQFDDLVRASLVAAYPEEVQKRLLEAPSITVQDVSSGRTFSEGSVANIILPFAVSIIFFFAISWASGYMLQVVADEKENRTMEVILTSLTPGQLIGGKSMGLLAAAVAQLAVYALAGVVGFKVAAPYVVELQQLTVPWIYLGLMLAFFLASFALVAASMIAIGSAVTEVQQGQQIAGVFGLIFAIPLFFMPIMLANPGHPLIVFFTFFPFTSFITVGLRWGLGSVPLWQVGAGWLILVATAGFMLSAAARVFRAGMLVYGQPLNLKAMVAAVRGV